MSDRLSELLRQRALVQEHLAWLNREVAVETEKSAHYTPSAATAATAPAPPVPPTYAPLPSTNPASAAAAAAGILSATMAKVALTSPEAVPAADVILDQYRVAPTALKEDIRKGCFLYFAIAFVLLGLGVAVMYFAISSK